MEMIERGRIARTVIAEYAAQMARGEHSTNYRRDAVTGKRLHDAIERLTDLDLGNLLARLDRALGA